MRKRSAADLVNLNIKMIDYSKMDLSFPKLLDFFN